MKNFFEYMLSAMCEPFADCIPTSVGEEAIEEDTKPQDSQP